MPDGAARQRRRPHPALVAAVTAVVIVALGAFGWFVWPGWGHDDPAEPAPTSTPSTDPDPTSPTTGSPSVSELAANGVIEGSGYTLSVPEGWSQVKDPGDPNLDASISDGDGTSLSVWLLEPGMPTCKDDIDTLAAQVPGTLTPVTDVEIGEEPVSGALLVGDDGEYYEVYCLTYHGIPFEIGVESTTAVIDEVKPVIDGLFAIWRWS